MGFDRTGDGEDAAADRPPGAASGPDDGGEIRERDGRAAVSAEREGGGRDGMPGTAGEAAAANLTAEGRIAASLRARAAADAVSAAWERETGRAETPAADPAYRSGADGGQRDPAAEDTSQGHPDADPAAGPDSPDRAPDTSPAAVEALRRRVSELEAGKAASGRRLAGCEARLAAQDKTITGQGEMIAGQGKQLAQLEASLGRVAAALNQLREKQDEQRASAEIEGRFRGKEAGRPEWKEEQHKRRLPADAVNSAAATALGSAITALPYQVHDFPPEVAGLAAGGVAFGAGIIAVWRERRKAKDDAGHRPEN